MFNSYIMKQLLVFCIILSVVNSAKLPNYLKKCKKGPGGSKCFVDNAGNAIINLLKDGEPKFKLSSLNPLHVDKISLQPSPELSLILEDVKFDSFETLKVYEGQIDDKQVSLKAYMDRMEVAGGYTNNGRILALPIQGKGTCNMTFVGIDYDYKGMLEMEERDGKTYLKIDPSKSVMNITRIKRVYWQFDNLFSGDPRLGPEMNRLLNENWQDVYNEVAGGIQKTTGLSIFYYYINGFLHYVPTDELFE